MTDNKELRTIPIIGIISPICGGPGFKAPGIDESVHFWQPDNRSNRSSPCHLYEDALRIAVSNGARPEVIVYAHDDVEIHDSFWKERLMAVFNQDENIVAVGLGGAVGLGNWDLYRKPYDIRNLARRGFLSNLTDAEVHGTRWEGSRRVATLDAFCMGVRSSFIDSVGGWPVDYLTHHCLDTWLACEAARHGKEIWMTGISSTHLGGRTSTKESYQKARWLQGGTVENDHALPHIWIWNEYRDVLPISL